jgi:dihydroorotate dehydrogenase electron transfer subunit
MKNKALQITGKVAVNQRMGGDYYLMKVLLDDSFPEPLPGQFIMVRVKGKNEPFLGRPFSLYHYEQRGRKVSIQILYRVVGKGTRILSELKRGEHLDIFGPQGRSFMIYPSVENAILISGGVGVAPISYLASYYKKNISSTNVKIICYQGAKTADHLSGLEDLREVCSTVKISTDDGSYGYQGMITELFATELTSYDPARSIIYVCGPLPMLKRIYDILDKHPIPCQVLLERRMACAVGACLGCVTEIKTASGENTYARVCKEGPVFNIEDIVWD